MKLSMYDLKTITFHCVLSLCSTFV